MESSKWSKYNSEIDELIFLGRTDWSKMSSDILGEKDLSSTLRTYIKRRANKSSIVDETLHRGKLDDSWSCAWVKDKDTGVSVLVKNKDFKNSTVVDYDLIRSDMVDEIKKLSPFIKEYKRKEIKDPHCLILDIADLHVGKLSTIDGADTKYNVDLAISRAIEGTESLIDKSKPYNIDQIYFIIGNDVLHIDNPKRTTTSGTPQDTDGMWYDNFKIARAVYCNIIQKLTSIAKVHVIHCPSNHDYMSGFMLADAVYCYYHNDENVTFDVSNVHRKYVRYGVNMLGFSHGDGAKIDQIPYLAAHESKEMWALTTYRYTFLHHIHHKDYFKFRSGKDFIGMTVEYLRSPSESDRWFSDNGYKGAKVSIEAFIHHPVQGQISRLSHNF